MDFLPHPATIAVADRLIAAAAAAEQVPAQALQAARADAADWGRAIHHGCRSIAAVLVLIGLALSIALQWAIVAAEATYAAGFRLGCWVHAANDWLAPRWAAFWVPPAPKPAAPAAAPLALPAAAAPLALLAPAPEPVAPAAGDPLASALDLIAAGFSIRRAAREVGMARSTLQRRLREVAA